MRRTTEENEAIFTNNPVEDELRVFGLPASVKDRDFTILDLQGRPVRMLRGSGGPVETFNISGIPAGTYVLHIRQENTLRTLRFQKN